MAKVDIEITCPHCAVTRITTVEVNEINWRFDFHVFKCIEKDGGCGKFYAVRGELVPHFDVYKLDKTEHVERFHESEVKENDDND